MRIKVDGYVAARPNAWSCEFQFEYSPQQIAEFLISETKFHGIVIVDTAVEVPERVVGRAAVPAAPD